MLFDRYFDVFEVDEPGAQSEAQQAFLAAFHALNATRTNWDAKTALATTFQKFRERSTNPQDVVHLTRMVHALMRARWPRDEVTCSYVNQVCIEWVAVQMKHNCWMFPMRTMKECVEMMRKDKDFTEAVGLYFDTMDAEVRIRELEERVKELEKHPPMKENVGQREPGASQAEASKPPTASNAPSSFVSAYQMVPFALTTFFLRPFLF